MIMNKRIFLFFIVLLIGAGLVASEAVPLFVNLIGLGVCAISGIFLVENLDSLNKK
jgi:hypothetical protein